MQNEEEIEFQKGTQKSEKAFIGAILLDNALMDYAVHHIQPNSFLIRRNRQVFSAMVELHKRQQGISPQAILNELKAHGEPVDQDFDAYIASLIENVPPYITNLKDDHFQRFAILTVFMSVTDTLLSDVPLPQMGRTIADKFSHLRQLQGIDPLVIEQLQDAWRDTLR